MTKIKVVLHIALYTELDKIEDLQKKYQTVFPILTKDEEFTILKYDTEFIRPPPENEEQ